MAGIDLSSLEVEHDELVKQLATIQSQIATYNTP